MDIKKILEKEGIGNFDEDIRLMSSKALRKHFRFKTRRKLSPTRLIKNLIWQAFTWISDGRMEPIKGNIRSFWYISVKPVLSRLGLKVSGRKYSEIVYRMFVELVTVHRLFRYSDFGFLDDRVYHRTIGKRNGHLVLFVEKDGMYLILRNIAQKYGATAIALGTRKIINIPQYAKLYHKEIIPRACRNLKNDPLLHLRIWDYLGQLFFSESLKWVSFLSDYRVSYSGYGKSWIATSAGVSLRADRLRSRWVLD